MTIVDKAAVWLAAFLYFQAAIGTATYYAHRRCVAPEYALPGACGVNALPIGVLWPVYWNYRLWLRTVGP
jgi:hypothetical protein